MNLDMWMSAGRVVNDISIEDICCQYKRRIFDLVSLLQNKIAVFDFDGTMTEFRYGGRKIVTL